MVSRITLGHANEMVQRHTVNEFGECGICHEIWPCKAYRVSYELLVAARDVDALIDVNEQMIAAHNLDVPTLDAAALTLTRVRVLHQPVFIYNGLGLCGTVCCADCGADAAGGNDVWPCETARIVYREEEIAAEQARLLEHTKDETLLPGVPIS